MLLACSDYNHTLILLLLSTVISIINSHYNSFIIAGMWTYQLEPSNKYVLSNVEPGWKLIEILVNEGKKKCDTIWYETIKQINRISC